VKPVEVAALFQRIMPDPEGRTEFHYVIVDFLCELEAGIVQAASDVADAGWFTMEETKRLKMAPGTPGVLDSALDLLGQKRLTEGKSV
jgi:hypothetical protein